MSWCEIPTFHTVQAAKPSVESGSLAVQWTAAVANGSRLATAGRQPAVDRRGRAERSK